MDELELLKKQWHRQERDLPELSYNDIYNMLLKKSSSIVRWIFLISIGEIIFWTGIAFLLPDSSKKFTDDIGLHNPLLIFNMIRYTVFAVFIFLFYKNYTKISNTDSIKKLMQSILRTRKTVRYFILYNIVGTCVILIGLNIYCYFNQDLVFQLMKNSDDIQASMNKEHFISMFFISQLVLGTLLIIGIIIFYRIVYGILLRRLDKNYKELKKIEV